MGKRAKTENNPQNYPQGDNPEAGEKHLQPLIDPIALGKILMDVGERAQPLLKEFIERHEFDFSEKTLDPMNMRPAYMAFMEKLMADPQKLADMQMKYWADWVRLWQDSAAHFISGEAPQDVYAPEKGDRRFNAPVWQESALFDFIKQSYLLTSGWMQKLVEQTEGLDPDTRSKIDFQTRQFINAIAPTNFLLTNPEALRETLDTGGENLIRGLENLIEDLERGHGELAISTTAEGAFEIGGNLAITPGKVIYQNELMQLIQYESTTEKVFKRPLLIVPPWINKYYILDLKPENSFIRQAIAQGHTVFTISWVNPDKRLAQKQFQDYMQEGTLEALDQVRKATGEDDVNIIGYCLGGTLTATTLAWLAAKGQQKRVNSATFLTTLIDFEKAGEMKLFIDDAQLALMNQEMDEKGFLPADTLKRTFSLLRSNDLIWSFVINNYLMGREPFPFDLLYWNDDATNMPAAMHKFYLCKLYQENQLALGQVEMLGTPIDITKIKTPCYFLSTKEDHIAPWKATYATTQLVGGPKEFTLAASGHVAGVVNPPAKKKYCYWKNPELPPEPEEWLEGAAATDGSWWTDWERWIKQHTGEKVAPRQIKKSIEDAPGSYVKARSA
jgi:polyhydroxyalkanoate synthase